MTYTPTLPGVHVSLSDSYITANDMNPEANRVLIIAADGSAATASHYDPVQYFSEAAVVAACGLGSDAHIAYVQALYSGATNIYVATVDSTLCTTPAGRESELASALAVADSVEPDLIVPFGFYANEIIPGEVQDTVTLRISRVDADQDIDTITFSIDNISDSDTNTPAVAWARVSVGDELVVSNLTGDGLAANGTYTVTHKLGTATSNPRIEAAWATAADISYDASAENPRATAVKTIAAQGARLSANAVNTATACYRMNRDLNPCRAIMGYVPITYAGTLPTAAEIATYSTLLSASLIAELTNETFAPAANVQDALKAVSVDTVTVDIGQYVFPFCGKVLVRNQPANDAGTPVVEYTGCEAVASGQVYSTELEDAITSSPLTNVTSITNNFSRAQKLALIGKKVNPVCLSSQGQIVTLDGWTLASPDANGDESVYNRISTCMIVDSVVKDTRNGLEKFIGMQASTARLNSIETALRTIYTAYKQKGILKSADFKIEYNMATGTLTVNLNIVPFGEIREVSLTVSVKINA